MKILCSFGTLFQVVLWGVVIGLVLGLALAQYRAAALDDPFATPSSTLALSMD